MIFVANVLVMNGGSTFLLRACKELDRRGIECAVLLLRNEYDEEIFDEVSRFARIILLSDLLCDKAAIFRAHLGVFAPVRWTALASTLKPFGEHIHTMGVFGLVFAHRLVKYSDRYRITTGIYHQNEFLYKPTPFYLPTFAMKLFTQLPDVNVCFFNELSRQNYQNFFGVSYAHAILAPIGIELSNSVTSLDNYSPYRIVSVGNLSRFKTYNRHMIEVVASIAKTYSEIRYDIYGAGGEEHNLRSLSKQLGVSNHVIFHGEIPYSSFGATVQGAALFVGSGTALLEAAYMGIPALIGIESIETSETYGFLSDISGFSYNENSDVFPKQSFLPLVVKTLADREFRSDLSRACKLKAAEFTIEVTIDLFIKLEQQSRPIVPQLQRLTLTRLAFSFLFIAILNRLGFALSFRDRRNQSYHST
jgi:1,2-diacylglycerol 3-alpha-glucosyltransferase